MSIYKIKFSYDGSTYFGWQKQPDQRSIQGEIEKVVRKISKSEDIQVIGCGRTDAGVHALSQLTRVRLTIDMVPTSLLRALNSLLPHEIKAIECEYSDDSFQPVFDAKSKTYRYIFSLKKTANPFLCKYVSFIGKDLDASKFDKACSVFIGEHDFAGFSTKGTPVKTTVRTIFSCSITKELMSYGAGQSEEVYVFEVKGNGFLKQMVRLIVSAVWSVAEGKISIEDIEKQLISPATSKLAPTAPPNGLYLTKVKY